MHDAGSKGDKLLDLLPVVSCSTGNSTVGRRLDLDLDLGLLVQTIQTKLNASY